ncbi:MAG: ADP-ribose pyrophosphatase YjhB (NUDIX family) [Cellvibrionaceae bacterium]|jgi:ADP-ribose pyrophosphatase YjhB (NUDIX family)
MTISRLRTSFLAWFFSFEVGRIVLKTGIKLLIPKHRVGVNVVCLDSENRVLMLKHTFHPLSPWGLPGGWMNRGEIPAECALRELREETGITSAVVAETILFFRNPGPDHLNIIVLAHIDAKQPKVTMDGVEIIDSMWITPATAPNKLTIHTLRGLQNAWATKNISFEFPKSQLENSAF